MRAGVFANLATTVAANRLIRSDVFCARPFGSLAHRKTHALSFSQIGVAAGLQGRLMEEVLDAVSEPR